MNTCKDEHNLKTLSRYASRCILYSFELILQKIKWFRIPLEFWYHIFPWGDGLMFDIFHMSVFDWSKNKKIKTLSMLRKLGKSDSTKDIEWDRMCKK